MAADLDIAVVGAGVAGLAAANALRRAGREVRVFEAAEHVGGRMTTVRQHGYRIDSGAEQLSGQGYQVTWRWLRELGVPAADVPRIGHDIGVWRDGRAHPGLAHPRALLTGAGLSGRARLDLAKFLAYTGSRRREFDPDHPESTPLGLATVDDLASRQHPDLGDYQWRPVVSSFFGWHPDRSAAAPFVCLLAAVGTTTHWRTYRDGMDTLARRLAERVEVSTGAAVEEVIGNGDDDARLVVAGSTLTARSVLLCVPAPVALRLYRNPPEHERPYLAASGYTPMLKVACLTDRPLAPRCARPLYALLTPGGGPLAGLIIDHAKHPARVPAGRGLITLIAAPAAMADLLDAPDAEVADRLIAPAERYVPGLRTATTETLVHRFRHGLPEVTPAALARRAEFMARPTSPVDYASDWVMARPNSEGALRAADLAVARLLARQDATVAKELI